MTDDHQPATPQPEQSIERFPGDGPPPLSFDQEGRLLLEWWLNRRRESYMPPHIRLGLGFSGPLDVGALEAALNSIIERHDVLRTAFLGTLDARPIKTAPPIGRVDRSGKPPEEATQTARRGRICAPALTQLIHARASLTLEMEHLEHVAPLARDHEVHRLAAEFEKAPFDYTRPPLMRAVLLTLSGTEHVLLIVINHLISDGWSLRVLTRELGAWYSRFTLGSPPPRDLRVQYGDFAHWQRARLQGEHLTQLLSSVSDRYKDVNAIQVYCRDLSFAKSDRGESTFESAFEPGCEALTLGAVLCRQMREFARQKRLSMYMVLLAALGTALNHHIGRPRIGVWGQLANRTRPEFEDLIGWFSTLRLLPFDFTSDPPMMDVLEQARRSVFDAVNNEDLPFVLLWNALSKDARAAGTSSRLIGQAHVSFNYLAWSSSEWPDVPGMRAAALRTTAGDNALRFTAIDDGDRITLLARYSKDILHDAGVRQLVKDVETIGANIIERPKERLSSFHGDSGAAARSARGRTAVGF